MQFVHVFRNMVDALGARLLIEGFGTLVDDLFEALQRGVPPDLEEEISAFGPKEVLIVPPPPLAVAREEAAGVVTGVAARAAEGAVGAAAAEGGAGGAGEGARAAGVERAAIEARVRAAMVAALVPAGMVPIPGMAGGDPQGVAAGRAAVAAAADAYPDLEAFLSSRVALERLEAAACSGMLNHMGFNR